MNTRHPLAVLLATAATIAVLAVCFGGWAWAMGVRHG